MKPSRVALLVVGAVLAALCVVRAYRGGALPRQGAHPAEERALPPPAPDQPTPRARSSELARAPEVTIRALLELPAAAREELEFMRDLRAITELDAELAVERAREGNVRFTGSAHAPERTSILIHALARVGRAAEARAEAEDMVNRYPDSAWVREVERFTGAHRHRNLRLGDTGQLIAE